MLRTYRGVRLSTLGLCEFLEALRLVAHDALKLDNLLTTCTAMALDRLGDAALSLDLVAEVRELLGGVLQVRQVFGTTSALDLLGNRNALEAGLKSVSLHECLS